MSGGSSGGEDDSALHARFRALNSSQVALGVRLLRWMLAQPSVTDELVENFDLRAVRYAHASARDLVWASLQPASRRIQISVPRPVNGSSTLGRTRRKVRRQPA